VGVRNFDKGVEEKIHLFRSVKKKVLEEVGHVGGAHYRQSGIRAGNTFLSVAEKRIYHAAKERKTVTKSRGQGCAKKR
jgi:hypothetical protein